MPRLSADGYPDEVPPVPPLPAGIPAAPPRPLSGGHVNNHQPPERFLLKRHSAEGGLGAKGHERGEKVGKRSSRGKKGVDINALLGSIDAVAGSGERMTGIGIGRPPY